LWQVGGFLRVLRFPPSMKLIIQDDIAETMLKVALNIFALPPPFASVNPCPYLFAVAWRGTYEPHMFQGNNQIKPTYTCQENLNNDSFCCIMLTFNTNAMKDNKYIRNRALVLNIGS
jgi:hypothetical protein